MSHDCFISASSTPLLTHTSAPSWPPRRADMGPLKISSDVSSQLCPQTRLFSSHTKPLTTCHMFTSLQLYMRLVLLPLFVPCQPGKLILQNSVKMLPPGEKLHQLPWALSSLLFWGAAIKNHYTFTWHSSVYLSLHKGSHVHSSQNTRGCGNVCRVYARA